MRAGQELDVQVTAEALTAPQDLEGGQHPIGRFLGASGHARGEEEAIDQPLAVRLHEGRRRVLGGERGSLHFAAAERRAIAARQRARVGLHDAHERRAAAAGKADASDADLVTDPGGCPQPGVSVEARRLREDGQPLAPIHDDYYT